MFMVYWNAYDYKLRSYTRRYNKKTTSQISQVRGRSVSASKENIYLKKKTIL